jgi:phospholipid transport system substrate-binding protein
LVTALCREAVAQRRPLVDLLALHPEISRHLDRQALDRLLRMVDRVLNRRATACIASARTGRYNQSDMLPLTASHDGARICPARSGRSARALLFGRRRSLITAALIVLFLASGWYVTRTAASGQPSADPLTAVEAAVNDTMAVFKDKSLPLVDRREKLRALATRHFDFQDMARSALGYHWRELTPAQRDQFIPLFAGFIQDAYLSKLQEYSVQKVQQTVESANIQFTRQTFDGPDYAQVYSTVVLHDLKEPVQVNYLMHRAGDQWRIYDVSVDAISVIANYRNQFNRVINSQGYLQLVADLRVKQQQLQNDLERSSRPAGSR